MASARRRARRRRAARRTETALPVASAIASEPPRSAPRPRRTPRRTGARPTGRRARPEAWRARRCPGPARPRGWRARGSVVVPQLEHAIDWTIGDSKSQRMIASCPSSASPDERLEREPQRRHARGGALRAPVRQAVENEVDRSRRAGAAGALGPPRQPAHTGVGIEPSGVHGRSERLEVGLACQCRIECFEPPGGVEQERRTRRCRA